VAAGAFIFFRSYGPHERTRAGQMGFHRELIDAEGHRHEWSYNLAAGMTLSAFVGLASSILGIGGGIIHVPAMVSLLNFPVHFATATSHFILAAMSLAGTIEHIADGTLGRPQAARLVAIGLGAMVGAQIGARLSRRIHGRWIMKSLAVALGLVGVRILVAAAMSR
jgi:hypothetical protein